MGVGQINANGTGSFTGIESVNDDGVIYNNQSLTGTYSISSNCTGSGTIKNIKNGLISHYNFVVDPVGIHVDAAGIITLIVRCPVRWMLRELLV